jgi:hypothetical protein
MGCLAKTKHAAIQPTVSLLPHLEVIRYVAAYVIVCLASGDAACIIIIIISSSSSSTSRVAREHDDAHDDF